jgi:hypothetical protein
MATPVSLQHPWLHLDSILRHVIDERTYGRDADYSWDDEMRGNRTAAMRAAGTIKYLQVLDRYQADGDWLSCASVSQFFPEDTPYGTLQYFKRFHAERFPVRGKVNLSSDHYRAWMLKTIYLPCDTVTFYGRGLLGQVRDLVGDLTHLGNDVRIGWGEIADWTLEPTPEDWSLVRDGRAMRPIPTRMLREWDDEAWLTWHAPYWDRRKVEVCAPPGARVVLR